MLLERTLDNTLAFFHWPLPHWPFGFNQDGSYAGHRGRLTDERGAREPEGYLRQLGYLDLLFGKIVKQLRAGGKFKNAMIVLTSDHGATTRFWEDDELKHVPLIIKLPGRESGHVIDEPFGYNQLAPIIEGVLDGRMTVSKALEIVRQ